MNEGISRFDLTTLPLELYLHKLHVFLTSFGSTKRGNSRGRFKKKMKVGTSNKLVRRTERPKRIVPEERGVYRRRYRKMTELLPKRGSVFTQHWFYTPTVVNWQQTHSYSTSNPLPHFLWGHVISSFDMDFLVKEITKITSNFTWQK
jgi:hypothetical protein